MRLGIDASNISEGGGPTHLIEVLHAANPQDYGFSEVVVWTNERIQSRLPDRPWLRIVHDPLLDRSLPYRIYWQSRKLPRLATAACDLLFVPGGSYVGSFRPYVTMSQNLLPFDPPVWQAFNRSEKWLKMPLLRRIQARSFQGADGVIFLTQFACEKVKSQVPAFRGHLAVIPHGVNNRFFSPPRPPRQVTRHDFSHPLRMLYVSSINVYKHHAEVAAAVARLRNEGFPLQLDLVGWPYRPLWPQLRQAIWQHDPQEQFITYRGALSYEEMPLAYQQADLFIFASGCETISITLLEAMASGLPIACSKLGPMPEVLGEAGEYFDPTDPADIAAVVRGLILAPDQRAAYAQAAYERAQSYSWRRCATETLAFLARVAHEATAAGTHT